MLENEVETLRNQLKIARNEINKLRQQVKNLQYVQRNDVDSVRRILQDFRCSKCRQDEEAEEEEEEAATVAAAAAAAVTHNHCQSSPAIKDSSSCETVENAIHMRYIGVIHTAFAEKRGLPRQSHVGGRLRGYVKLNDEVFTNPAHSLEGLSEYSHLWLIYHFHRNHSHPKAKVAPPRLDGERVGVFSTRSPHRPCPIGLSLVEIENIDSNTISFYGTDMIDGTPVIDIKPYIPSYDAPGGSFHCGRIATGSAEIPPAGFYDSRQEPDGEESELNWIGAGGAITAVTATSAMNGGALSHYVSPAAGIVKVPNWVTRSNRLSVCFNERAELQMQELKDLQRQCIIDILEADPRSVYLRTKHGSQIFTFQLGEMTVTCKFDDRADTVTVVQIRRTEDLQSEGA